MFRQRREVPCQASRPFRFEELLARIRLRLRTAARTPEVTVLRSGDDLSLDLRTRRARSGERTVDLTAREFVLLELAAFLVSGARTVRQLVHLTTAALVVTAFAVPATSGRAALALPVFLALARGARSPCTGCRPPWSP